MNGSYEGRTAASVVVRPFLVAWLALALATPAAAAEVVPAGGEKGACRIDSSPGSAVPDPESAFGASILALSERGCRALSGRPFDRARVERKVSEIASRVERQLGNDRDPRRALAAIGRVVFAEERFAYDASGTDPDLYMLDRVIERKRGNCLGLTLLYDLVGERIGLPLTGAYVPGHILVRYESGPVRVNVETSRQGEELSDAEYRRAFGLGKDRPYLRTLDRRGIAAVFLKTVGATCACARRDEQALAWYAEAFGLYPELSDIHFNTGVSLQRTGRPRGAEDAYRKCLSIDPDHAPARDNLEAVTKRRADSCDFRRVPPKAPAGGGGS
jgi:tetratricopeptide (TPR) repeat protein